MTAGAAAVRAPVLLAVAHGSRDGAAQDSVAALARRVSRLAPALDVRTAFVQHARPSLADALTCAAGAVIVVPLLLSTGYHLTADIRAAARAAGAPVAAPLGPDPLLAHALADRLAEALASGNADRPGGGRLRRPRCDGGRSPPGGSAGRPAPRAGNPRIRRRGSADGDAGPCRAARGYRRPGLGGDVPPVPRPFP